MTRIFIENNELDISEGLSNFITYAIDDLQNLDSKQTPFTKTIIIPGTNKNNSILGNIFEITNSNFTNNSQPNVFYNYNASKAATCRIEVNGLQLIKGVFRLLEIHIDGRFIEYECAVFGELGGFISSLSNKRLEDLDFSVYDHRYSIDNIVQSWDQSGRRYNSVVNFVASGNRIETFIPWQFFPVGCVFTTNSSLNPGPFTVLTNDGNFNVTITVAETVVNELTTADFVSLNPVGTGYYYPLIDYGNVSINKHDYQYPALRPALFVREYLDKIITGNGYTWECDFFDTDFFKRLIIPNNDKALLKFGVVSYIHALYIGGTTFGTAFPTSVPPLYPRKIPLGSSILNNFSTSDNITFTHTGATNISAKAILHITGLYSNLAIYDNPLFIEIVATQGTQSYEMPLNDALPKVPGLPLHSTYDVQVELTVPFAPGDQIYIQFRDQNEDPRRAIICYSAQLDMVKDPPGFIELLIGDDVTMNIGLPKGVLQKDFFISILKLFYLEVTEDKFKEKHLVIKPWIDFYNKDRDSYVDWSDKLDRSQVIKLKPMSELNARYYQLKFRQDNDFYNDDYRKKYNTGYGDYIFDTVYDFAKETDITEIIFAASPLIASPGQDKVTPGIMKKSGGIEEQIAHVIRIMQKKKVEDVSSWDILDNDTVLGSYTDYPYAGHFDDPDAPNSDINFGATNELYFDLSTGNLSSNLFNAFYSPYMAEITDKDSRLLSAKFHLTQQDIFDLDFSKFIYIDGGLFRLVRVVDYNTNGDDTSTVELLRVINTIY